MGRYSDSSEQRFRQLFEREFDWMQFNLLLGQLGTTLPAVVRT